VVNKPGKKCVNENGVMGHAIGQKTKTLMQSDIGGAIGFSPVYNKGMNSALRVDPMKTLRSILDNKRIIFRKIPDNHRLIFGQRVLQLFEVASLCS